MTFLGLVHDREQADREFRAALHDKRLQSPVVAGVAGGQNARARAGLMAKLRARARGAH